MKLNKYSSVVLAVILLFCGFAYADKQKLVIQVSTADPLAQKIALNNAVNVQKSLGMDKVDVEIMAYGPGLSLLTKKVSRRHALWNYSNRDMRIFDLKQNKHSSSMSFAYVTYST